MICFCVSDDFVTDNKSCDGWKHFQAKMRLPSRIELVFFSYAFEFVKRPSEMENTQQKETLFLAGNALLGT